MESISHYWPTIGVIVSSALAMSTAVLGVVAWRLWRRESRERDQSKELSVIARQSLRRWNQPEGKSLAQSAEGGLSDTERQYLNALDKVRDRFITDMDREIRTPLNAVIGLSSALEGTELDEFQQDCVMMIRNSGESLMYLLTHVLEFARLESGTLDLEKKPVFLSEMLAGSFRLQGESINPGVETNIWVDPQLSCAIRLDPLRVQQIINHLVGNAVRHTRQGEIEVLVEPVRKIDGTRDLKGADIRYRNADDPRERLCLSVRDTGSGMPENVIKNLFHSRGAIDRGRFEQSSGIGLQLCQKLSRLMGGDLWVESKKDYGTTLHLVLPYEEVKPSQKEKVPERLLRKKALFACANETTADILERYLGEMGIRWHHSSPDLVKLEEDLRRDDSFDFLILDGDSPHLEVAGVVELLKAVGVTRESPIHTFFLSRKPVAISRSLKETYPLDGTILKPFTLHSLSQTLSDSLEHPLDSPSAGPLRGNKEWNGQNHPRVLVVEDSIPNQRVALKLMESLGLQVDQAFDGKEALKKVGDADYDLILMDLVMPELDGLETTQIIRDRFRNRKQPVIIALTACSGKSTLEQCLLMGMDGFLTKPLRKKDLERVVQKYLVLSETRKSSMASMAQ